ncbi:IucA/IucC family protein [Bacillus weihaiensis]|uniref:IucA/IucC family siderophore biosynthesis protein n=1 Tax=Bacillus weihaiensis TaxID=1547283 RepID=A0A1L3MRA1_9BACI|nr:IucA/IucC family protein [Bacillus weihaiensis]APH04895.1 hypothetical protein A9C19_09110 [Bacillus weihaiensis]
MRHNTTKSSKPLFEEEQAWLAFLATNNPTLVSYYEKQLTKGRKGILFKLASSMLRENLLNLYSSSTSSKKGIPDAVIQQLPVLEGHSSYFFYLIDKGYLVFVVEKEYGFRRIQLKNDIYFIKNGECRSIETASELLEIFKSKLPPAILTLQEELNNGSANYTMSLAFYEKWKEEHQHEAESTIHYAELQKLRDPDFHSSLFFEQLATEGHHLHPGAKTKIGLQASDVFRFSPEFMQSQNIRFVAVKREQMLAAESENGEIARFYPGYVNQAKAHLERKGYNFEDFILLPVHDWQYHHVLPKIYTSELVDETIILLEEMLMEGSASSSFRTIWPNGELSFKLAVNSQMTSTVRSISTQTTMNSIHVTKVFKEIFEKETELKGFLPINEVAGYSFQSENDLKSRNLSVVIRESIEQKLEKEELAIVASSLYHISPFSGKTVLHELLDEYCKEQALSKAKGTRAFLQDYLSLTLSGFLTLLVKYGIALEGHMQNSVPVFKNGKPVRFFFRDWGGMRIYLPRLEKQGLTLSLYPHSVSVTDDETELRNKAYYTIFQNHLSEIVIGLSEYGELDEKELWKIVKTECDKQFQLLENQGFVWAKDDASYLYRNEVEHKSLTKMRLFPDAGYCYSMVPNPLDESGDE